MNIIEVCLFNKFGHCKFQANCRKRHVETICEREDCEILNCNQRHPRECSYYRHFNRCKFGSYCSFTHKTSKDEKIEKLRNEIDCMKSSIEKLDRELELKKQEIEFIMKVLKSNNKTVETVSKNVDIQEEEKEEVHQEQEHVSSFKCEFCAYESSSRKGVNIHPKKIHKEQNIGNENKQEAIRIEANETTSDMKIISHKL